MSKDAAREFLLRAEMNEEIRGRMEGVDLRDAADIASEFGYECDGDELVAVAEEMDEEGDMELSLDDMSEAAGGIFMSARSGGCRIRGAFNV